MVSPNGERKFYFLSQHKEIENKAVKDIGFNSVYGVTHGGYCTSEEECGMGGKRIVPVIENSSSGKIKNLTSTFKDLKLFNMYSQIVGWKSNNSLLVFNGTGDAGFAVSEISVLKLDSYEVNEIYNCLHDQAGFSCVAGKIALVKECKPAAKCSDYLKAYKLRDNISFADLSHSKIIKQGKKLDEIEIAKDVGVNLTAEYNLNNLGKRLKIKLPKNKDAIFDFEEEKFFQSDKQNELQTEKKYEVNFSKKGIEAKFNFDEVPGSENIHVSVGPVIHTALSPNGKYLHITTGQGGGVGMFIYDIQNNYLYNLGNQKINEPAVWTDDSLLKGVKVRHFGSNPGKIVTGYISVSKEKPWVFKKIKSKQKIQVPDRGTALYDGKNWYWAEQSR